DIGGIRTCASSCSRRAWWTWSDGGGLVLDHRRWKVRAGVKVVFVFAFLFAVAAIGLQTPNARSRFVDNADGTISDKSTGLMWEKKTPCAAPSETDPHCVENMYEWTKSGKDPNGPLFTDFLAKVNRPGAGTKYNDWRIPTLDELKSILDCAK